jgi:DNA invertase Pin-like site-specific DNA recombinase
MSERSIFRCAIYTRKSSEEGLDQDFNSLKAQREACEAFIQSQKHEGWKLIAKHYDDGGLSGGTMERPGLQELLSDIQGGRVEIVLVYKIDRLTRSLMDFSKIVQVFEAQNVSFVSVTQQFSTNCSMGRLTLHMLLSFAQFEREVTAERIRDKIAASKKKGMWMGGLPPLGYDVKDRGLVVNRSEAVTVNRLFDLYLHLKSVGKLRRRTQELRILTKIRGSSTRMPGGRPFSRGHLYRLLSNPIYIGEISHHDNRYPGLHAAIVDRSIWEAAQTLLAANAPRRGRSTNAQEPSLLTGLIFDETGDRLSPSHAVKAGRRYRYYISNRLVGGSGDDAHGWRLPARELEQTIIATICGFLKDRARLTTELGSSKSHPDALRGLFKRAHDLASRLEAGEPREQRAALQALRHRIELRQGELRLGIDRNRVRGLLLEGDKESTKRPQGVIELITSISLKRRGVEAKLIVGNGAGGEFPRHDSNLIGLVARAHSWFEELKAGEITSIDALAAREKIDAGDVSRFLGLAFLAPDLVKAILEGRQPIELTAERLKRLAPLPPLWSEQRVALGFARSNHS